MADAPEAIPRPERTGKVAAAVATVVLLAGIVGLAFVVTAVRDRVPVKIVGVTESTDSTSGCGWMLEIELLNNSDEPLMVERISGIVNQGRQGSIMQDAPLIAPGEIGLHRIVFRLPPADPCPTVDEINHGNLIFHLGDGATESIRF